MANAPLITQVSYNGTAVSVWWNTSSDPAVTAYTVDIVYDANTVLFTATVQAVKGAQTAFYSVPLDSYQLDANIEYFVQVSTVWGSGPGQDEFSQLVPLITALPEIVNAYYDGTNLNFNWLPSPQAVQGYQLKAMQVSGGSVYSATVPSPSASQGMIPGLALPQGGLAGQSWQVAVCALGNIASNDSSCDNVAGCTPWLALPATTPALALTGAAFRAGAGLTAAWTPLTSGVTGYLMVVTSPQDGSRHALEIPDIAAGSATLRFPGGLSPDQLYDLQVIALNADGGGVSTPLTPLLTTPPQLGSVVYNQAGTGTIDLAWTAPGNASVTAYTLEVYAASGAAASYTATAPTGATSGSVPVPGGGFGTTQAWAARVTALAGSVVSAVGGSAPVYVAAPALANVVSDGDSVSAAWTPVSTPCVLPPDGYSLLLASSATAAPAGGAFVAGAGTGGGAVRLPGPSALGIKVAAVGGISVGPYSTWVPVVTQVPGGIAAVTDVLSGQTKLTWGAVPNATQYSLAFSSGIAAVQVQAAEYALPAAIMAPNTPLTVAIAGQAPLGGVAVAGPANAPFALPTGQPALAKAGYNGVSATVSWLPVPGASGYVATALNTAGAAPVSVASLPVAASVLSARLPFAAAMGQAYSVVVQATFNGANTGPLSASLPLFTPGFFPSETAATTCYPFVYPATALDTVLQPDAAKTGEPILLYLPDVGAGAPLTHLPYTQGAFTLDKNTGTGSAAYPYTLAISNTVAANNPWSFGIVAPATAPAAIRNGLRNDYINFLKGAEADGVAPWGIGYLQQILGRLLPQTLPELLYYNFGLTFPDATAGIAIGSVDLRPGMVLRVAVNPYQMVAGQSSTTSWYNGFVGGPEIDYDIGSMISNGGQWGIGFDNFIGQLVANGALTVDPPLTNRAGTSSQETGVADAADLYFPGFTGPFYRLFIPSKLMSPTGTVGNINTAANFILAPAATYADLAATGNTLTSAGNVLGYFRGRTLLKACVRVRCNGMGMVVPIGTTVGNLLERAGCLPPAANMPLGGIALRRNLGGAVLDPSAPLSPADAPLFLDWSTSASQLYGPNWDLLSMPLLSGDSVLFPA